MTGTDESAVDLTGRWHGHYTQHGTRRPIRAVLTQTGRRVAGTMEDLETEFDQSLFDAALEAGLAPGDDERIDQQLRRAYPEAGNVPIRSKSRLPPESTLEGAVGGGYVTLVKTYQGEHFCGYRMGDEEVGWVVQGHSVQYKGRIRERGNRIEGFWTIVQSEGPGPTPQGPFVLERAPGGTQRR